MVGADLWRRQPCSTSPQRYGIFLAAAKARCTTLEKAVDCTKRARNDERRRRERNQQYQPRRAAYIYRTGANASGVDSDVRFSDQFWLHDIQILSVSVSSGGTAGSSTLRTAGIRPRHDKHRNTHVGFRYCAASSTDGENSAERGRGVPILGRPPGGAVIDFRSGGVDLRFASILRSIVYRPRELSSRYAASIIAVGSPYRPS